MVDQGVFHRDLTCDCSNAKTPNICGCGFRPPGVTRRQTQASQNRDNGSIAMKLGISRKLFILFFLFILIFYGTVFNLFIKVQDMSKVSARIVRINNQVAALSGNLQDHLIDMEVNDKKFRVLKNPIYFEYFETARQAYNNDLEQIIRLDSNAYRLSGRWADIQQTYRSYTVYHSMEAFTKMPAHWGQQDVITRWMGDITKAVKTNDDRIKQALIRINDQSRQVVRNGMIGFGISIIVGVLGIVFISKSMLTPLNRLKTGLTQISNDNYTHNIAVESADEFGELAHTFNDMCRQLKADDDIRSDFIATLSHEIRTPLSSIQESVNMVIEELLGPVNEKQKKFLKLADSEITRITSLLNHLLDISVLASEARCPEPVPLSPNRLVKEAVRLLEPTAKIRQTTLEHLYMEDAPMVLGEKKEIMQVLMNIIGNAVKFSDKKGHVKIRLSFSRNREYLSFHISDTGPGIPKEKHTLIFKKYYRAEEVRQHMDGVGLGLNISKRIIQAHNGEITVTNNKECGCTFSFTLPIQKEIRA